MVKRKRDNKESIEAPESTLLHQAASEGNYQAVIFLLRHGFIDNIDQTDDEGKTPLNKVSEGYEELLANEYACRHSFDVIDRHQIKTLLSFIRKYIKKCKTKKDKQALIAKAQEHITYMIAKHNHLLDS